MIDINKKYRTRDGREVRIYATDGRDPFPVHGATKEKYGWNMETWSEGGRCDAYMERDKDLIEVRPRHNRTVWLNMYEIDEDRVGSISWDSKELADERKMSNRLACIKVELDFEEGEGL